MSVKQIFDKESELCRENAVAAHKAFADAIKAELARQNMTVNDLTIGAGVGPAQTYRALDPNENLSLLTMQRFAAPVGKKVVVSLVDLDEK